MSLVRRWVCLMLGKSKVVRDVQKFFSTAIFGIINMNVKITLYSNMVKKTWRWAKSERKREEDLYWSTHSSDVRQPDGYTDKRRQVTLSVLSKVRSQRPKSCAESSAVRLCPLDAEQTNLHFLVDLYLYLLMRTQAKHDNHRGKLIQ